MVNLKLASASFNKKLRKSRKGVSSFRKTIGAAGGALVKFGAAMAAITAGAVAVFVKREMQAIDATAKLADRLGVTTEALVKLRHAADIAGSSAAEIDKALSILVRRLGEVRMGTGEAKDGLEALGLQADALVRMSPAQVFREIAEAIAKLPTQADKAAAAYKLFGRQGQNLLNTLALGKTGLKELGDEAERLGLTFNRIDAAKVEQANDAITRMKAAFTGLARKLTVDLAPMLEAVAERLGQLGEGKSISGVAKFGDKVVSAQKGFWHILKSMATIRTMDVAKAVFDFGDSEAAIERIVDRLDVTKDPWAAHADFWERVKDLQAEAAQKWEVQEAARKKARDEAAAMAKAVASERAFGKQRWAFLAPIEAAHEAAVVAAQKAEKIETEAYEKRVKALENLADKARDVAEAIKTPVERFREYRSALEEMVLVGVLSTEQMMKALQQRYKELATVAMKPEALDPGAFKVIRRDIIDIAGLGMMGRGDPQLQRMDAQAVRDDRRNELLQDIAGKEGGLAP